MILRQALPGARRVVCALLLCVVATSVASCRRPPETITITVAESSLSIPASLSFVARTKGFWASEGLDVKVASFAAGRLAVDAMLNGQAQFATAAETPLATGAFRYDSYGIVCEMMNTTSETKVVARRPSGIGSATDLKGKTIAVFVGTQAEYFLDAFLKHHGMTRKDVKVINLQPPDQIAAVVKGDVDAIVAWQPHAMNAITRLGADAVVFRNEGFYTGVFAIATQRAYAEKNPAVVEKFLRGLIKAEELIRQNPEEAIGIVSKQVGIDPNDLRKFYGEYSFVVKLSPVMLQVLREEGQWAIDSSFVQSKTLPDYRQFLLPTYLRAIDPARVTLQD